jgi:hypothetical protein
MAYKTRTNDQPESIRPRRKLLTARMFFLACVLLVSPLIYEGGLICYGNWRSMTGAHVSIRTPVLDTLGEAYRESRFQLGRQVQPKLHTGHWTPATAVPLALVIAGIGVVLLRKGH